MRVPIALLTDFGLDDWYVGVMKGVILSIDPVATLIDLTHSVPPQDIEAANFAILASYRYMPEGSLIVIVVDPGVGGERDILCAETAGYLFLFPDNGVLTELLEREGSKRLVKVENTDFFLEPVSSTFHGRDIFAPVAAHLSLGLAMDELGPPVDAYNRIDISGAQLGDREITAHVRWVDRFGNLITDCSAGMVADAVETWGRLTLDLGSGAGVPIVDAYEGVGLGSPLGILGSSGYLEVSIREGDAAEELGLTLGDVIILRKP
jgi:S-adenosylmethionine hydrolase